MLQKAADLKRYKNLEIPAPKGNPFAVLDNDYLLHVAKSAHISLDANTQAMSANIASMKEQEIQKYQNFIDEFLESTLPANLDDLGCVQINKDQEVSGNSDPSQVPTSFEKKFHLQAAKSAMKHSIISDSNDDSSHVEY